MNPKRQKALIFALMAFVITIMVIIALNQPGGESVVREGGESPTISQLFAEDMSESLLPDAMLVYGPGSAHFDIAEFLTSHTGYLSTYSELVGGVSLSGAQIVQKVSEEYSVSPQLLLAILEYQSQWISNQVPDEKKIEYPISSLEPARIGLFRQLSWTADLLNFGYYARNVGAIDLVTLLDGESIMLNEAMNSATAGVYFFFSQISTTDEWNAAINAGMFMELFQNLYQFDSQALKAVSKSIPVQPEWQLPFAEGEVWAFTGGPHSAWGGNAAWAALDFAPPKEQLGCAESEYWVRAVADGTIVRTGDGQVVQDMDGDGLEQTGWVVLYMHIETRDRVAAGTLVNAGDILGHPSCEGGYSTGTHVHIARKYNGEWIPADQDNPFVLDGWVSSGTGIEYNGYLKKGTSSIEALDGRQETNEISR